MDICNTEGYLTSFDQEKIWFKTYSRVDSRHTTGPKIIFIHGLSNDGQVWEGVIELLLNAHPQAELITYDLRGHGGSSQKFNHLTRLYRLEEVHARDLSRVIAHLGGYRPILVGHSFGGLTIQEYLLKTNFFPWSAQKPRGIVLVGTNIHTPQIKSLDRVKLMPALMKLETNKKSLPKKRPFNFYQKHYATRTKDGSPLNVFYAFSSMNRENFLRHWLGMINWFNADPVKMLKKLGRVPLILIYAEKDQIFPAAEVRSTLHTYPQIQGVLTKTTHAIPIQAPDVIAREISSLL